MNQNQDFQAVRPSWQTPVIAGIVLATVAIGFVWLERDRTQKQQAEEVSLQRTREGKVLDVVFNTAEVTEDQWSQLANSTDTLRQVDPSNTTKVAGGLAPLAKFPHLNSLALENCSWVNDAEAARIAGRHRLKVLVASGTQLTDQGMKEFDFSELTMLRMERCAGVTDETFEMLSTLPELRHLFFDGTQISFDQYERLRQARPRLQLSGKPPLSWQRGFGEDTHFGFDQLSHETNLDEFVRYQKLAGYGPVHGLALGGTGVSRSLPVIFAGFPELSSLAICDTKLEGGLGALPSTVTSLHLAQLHAGS